MEQLEFFEIPSPCIGVCEVNERGFCRGCFRKRDERQRWLTMTNPEKKEVLRKCQQRKLRAAQAQHLERLRQLEG